MAAAQWRDLPSKWEVGYEGNGLGAGCGRTSSARFFACSSSVWACILASSSASARACSYCHMTSTKRANGMRLGSTRLCTI